MKMFLFTLLFLMNMVDINPQPVMCNSDIHCSVGFFCHTLIHSCHECLSCEHLRRHPGPKDNDCIKSARQCGPCFKGLINDEPNWKGALCVSPEPKNTKILTTFLYVLVTCITTGVLISLFIIRGIWKTNIIKINIAIPISKKSSTQPCDSNKR